MSEPLTGKEFDEAVQSRQAARQMALDAANRGDGICGALFALEASDPLAAYISRTLDYSDEDDEERPF